MNPYDERAQVETIRWKARTRKVLGITDLIEDADGSRRIVAEGEWLAVVLPPEMENAYIESLERALVRRTFVSGPSIAKRPMNYVAELVIETSIGMITWKAQTDAGFYEFLPSRLCPTNPMESGLAGTLSLPDGSLWPTDVAKGSFNAPNIVRAYQAWRDVDVNEGWTVITEVQKSVTEELRPVLAALPLLLFTTPPR